MKVFIKDPEVSSKVWTIDCDTPDIIICQLLYSFVELRKSLMGAAISPCQIRLKYKQIDLSEPARLKTTLASQCGRDHSSLSLNATWHMGWSASNCKWNPSQWSDPSSMKSLCPTCSTIASTVLSSQAGFSGDVWSRSEDRHCQDTDCNSLESLPTGPEVVETKKKSKKRKDDKKMPTRNEPPMSSGSFTTYNKLNNNNMNMNINEIERYISTPELLKDLERLIATAAKSTNIVFQLESLSAMKNNGDITPEEFSRIKKRILNNYLE